MRLLLLIILVVASLGLFVLYTNPTYQDIQRLQTEFQEYDIALTQSAQVRRLRDELLSRRNTFSADDVRALERMLPENIDNIRLIIDINDIAARYNLQVRGVSVSSGATQGGTPAQTVARGKGAVGSVDLSFTISATYDQFITFLQDIERSLRIIDIRSIKFGTGANDINDYSVSIRTYWLR